MRPGTEDRRQERSEGVRVAGRRSPIYRRRSAGLTLIELMIAMALSALVAATIVAILSAGQRIFRGGTHRLVSFQDQRVILDRMAKEIEEAAMLYEASDDRLAFYRQGYSLQPYAGPPLPDDKKYQESDIVVFGCRALDSANNEVPCYCSKDPTLAGCTGNPVTTPGQIYREVWRGDNPADTSSPYHRRVYMTQPDVEIRNLHFTYFNFMGVFPYERLSPTPIQLTTTGYSPGQSVRKVPAAIGPATYPQNIWRSLTFGHTPSGNPGPNGEMLSLQTRFMRIGGVAPGQYTIWWDDGFPGGASASGTAFGNGCPGGAGGSGSAWETLPDGSVYSGDQAYCLSAGISPNDTAERYFQGAPAAGGGAVPDYDEVIYQNSNVPSGVVTINQDLNLHPDVADNGNATQVEVTLAANVADVAGEAVFSSCTGNVIITGKDAALNPISETLEFSGCGDTQTTFKRFRVIDDFTTVDLANESPVPAITLTNPQRKVWLFTTVFIDPNPVKQPKALMIKFRNSAGAWRGAYWSAFIDRPKVDDWFPAGVLEAPVATYRGTGREGFNRQYMGTLPASGGWVTLGVPVSAPGIRLEAATVDGQGFVVYGSQARVVFDKATVGTWSCWTGRGGCLVPDNVYTGSGALGDSNPSTIKGEAGETGAAINAHFIQFRGKFETPALDTGPVLHNVDIAHGQGGVWSQSVLNEWRKGTFNNTIPSGDDVELFRVSKANNIVQGEEGPIAVAGVEGTSYHTSTNIWERLYWIRSAETGWAVDFIAWPYRRIISVADQDGLPYRRGEMVEAIVTTRVCTGQDNTIRVTTRNGTEKPYQYEQYMGGCDHRILFQASVRPFQTNFYYVYYKGANDPSPPAYTKGSTPAWPQGKGVAGYYFRFNRPQASCRDGIWPIWALPCPGYQWFPANPGYQWWPNATIGGQGEFRGARLDPFLDNLSNTQPFTTCGTVYGIPTMSGCGSDYFSVAWRGYLYANQPGTWDVKLDHKDGGRLTVKSTVATLDNIRPDNNHWTTNVSQALSQGMHRLEVDYYNYEKEARVRLKATGPAGSWAAAGNVVAPQSELYFQHKSLWYSFYGWDGVTGSPKAPRELALSVGSEQTQTSPSYAGTIQMRTRGSNDGRSWSAWSAYYDPPNYGPPCPGASCESTSETKTIDPATGNFRYLQYQARLTTSDDSPIIADVYVCNAALADAYGSTCAVFDTRWWVVQTAQDDFEAANPGTFYNAADPLDPDNYNVSVNVRKVPGTVYLMSSVGKEEEYKPRANLIDLSKKYYSAEIWDMVRWRLGNMFWFGGPRQCFKQITITNSRDADEFRGGTQLTTRFVEPIDVTVPVGDCTGFPSNCNDIKLTGATGFEMPYERVSASSCGTTSASVTIRFLASVIAGSTAVYNVFYGWDPAEGGPAPGSPPVYVKSAVPSGNVEWPAGVGVVRQTWYNAIGETCCRMRRDFYQGMRIDPFINWGDSGGECPGCTPWDWPSQGNTGQRSYFSARWRGWIYLNQSTTYNFRMIHREGGLLQLGPGFSLTNRDPSGSPHWDYGDHNPISIWFNRGFHRLLFDMDIAHYTYPGVRMPAASLRGVDAIGNPSNGTVIPRSSYYTNYYDSTNYRMAASVGSPVGKGDDPIFKEPFGRVTVSLRGFNEFGADLTAWGCQGGTPCTGSELGPNETAVGGKTGVCSTDYETPCSTNADCGAGAFCLDPAQTRIYSVSLNRRFSQFRATLTGTDAVGNPTDSFTPVLESIWMHRKPDDRWFKVGNPAFCDAPWMGGSPTACDDPADQFQMAFSDASQGYLPGLSTSANLDFVSRAPDLILKQKTPPDDNKCVMQPQAGPNWSGMELSSYIWDFFGTCSGDGASPGSPARHYRRVANNSGCPKPFCQPAGNSSTDSFVNWSGSPVQNWGQVWEPFRREVRFSKPSGNLPRWREPQELSINTGFASGGHIRYTAPDGATRLPHWLQENPAGTQKIMVLTSFQSTDPAVKGPYYVYYGREDWGWDGRNASTWEGNKANWDNGAYAGYPGGYTQDYGSGFGPVVLDYHGNQFDGFYNKFARTAGDALCLKNLDTSCQTGDERPGDSLPYNSRDRGMVNDGGAGDFSLSWQYWLWVPDSSPKTYYLDWGGGIQIARRDFDGNCDYATTNALTYNYTVSSPGDPSTICHSNLGHGFHKFLTMLPQPVGSGWGYLNIRRSYSWHDHDPSTLYQWWIHNDAWEARGNYYGFWGNEPVGSYPEVDSAISEEFGKRNWYLNVKDYGDQAFSVSFNFVDVNLGTYDYLRVYNADNGALLWQRKGGGAWSGWTGFLTPNVTNFKIVYTWSGSGAGGARLNTYAYIPAVSNAIGAGTEPWRAVNNSLLSTDGFWRSGPLTDPTQSWWLVDLGDLRDPTNMGAARPHNVAQWAMKVNEAAIPKFQVEVSTDLSAWKRVESSDGKWLNNTLLPGAGGGCPTMPSWSYCDSFTPQKARYVRVTFVSHLPVLNVAEMIEFRVWSAQYLTPATYVHEQPMEPAVMTKDIQYLRLAAGQVNLHFSELFLTGPNDKVQIYHDATNTLLVEYTYGSSQNMLDGSPPPGPADDPDTTEVCDGGSPTMPTNGLGFCTGWLGFADLRIELHYNHTTRQPVVAGIPRKPGYVIDAYITKPVATCSSNQADCDKVIDRRPPTAAYTKWNPTGGESQPWVEIDMGRVTSINKVGVVVGISGEGGTYKFKVEYSSDGETYTPITKLSPNPPTDTWNTGIPATTSEGFIISHARVDAQYILITFNTGSPVHLYEIRIWETPYLSPGEMTSEVLAPRRQADGPVPSGEVVVDSASGRGYGTWNSGGNFPEDWSFNNYQWAGGWVASSPGSGNYVGIMPDGTTSTDLNMGVWDGVMRLRYNTSDRFIHSPQDTANGLFDAGILDPFVGPPLDQTQFNYEVAKYLQVTMRVTAAQNMRWAYLVPHLDGTGTRRWHWNYTNWQAVAANNWYTYTWDMADGASYWGGNPAGAIDWPWMVLYNGAALDTITPSSAGWATKMIGGALRPLQPPHDLDLGNGDSTPPLQIEVSGGTDNTGTMTITGVDASGASVVEKLTFREAGTMNTKKKFARVDNIATSGFTDEATVPNIRIRVLSWSGSIGQIALQPLDTAPAGTEVWIDNIRVQPKTSYQKVVMTGTGGGSAIPGSTGSAFLNLHFDTFNLQGDDVIEIWGYNQATGQYDVPLRHFDRNSFPATGGWTGNTGWGYDIVQIRFIFNPNTDPINNPISWRIDQYYRSHRFYRSSIEADNQVLYGAYCAGDGDDPDSPCVRNAASETYWKSKDTNPSNPVPDPWPVAGFPLGWYVDLWPDPAEEGGQCLADYDTTTLGCQRPVVNKVVLKWNNDPKDFIIATSDDGSAWTEVTINAIRGTAIYFNATETRYVGIFPLVDASQPDRSVELIEVEVYEAGPYVDYGTYISQPYQAPSHSTWVVPYPKDAFDIRLLFSGFHSQLDSTRAFPFHDNLRIYNDITGGLMRTYYGGYQPGSGNPLITQTAGDPANMCGKDTGLRTEWLFAGNDGPVPNTAAPGFPSTPGQRLRMIWTGPLGYEPVNSWQIICYELYTAINPNLIEISTEAAVGTGRNRKEASLSTRVQPLNLIFRP